jgi:hypothetical protein
LLNPITLEQIRVAAQGWFNEIVETAARLKTQR